MKTFAHLLAALTIAGCAGESTSPGNLTFAQVSAGDAHTCALTTGGDAYCWGHNDAGQLGIGAADSLPHPAPSLVAGGRHYVAIAAATAFSCAISTSGGTWCWGQSALGQIGSAAPSQTCTGGLPCVPAPALVTGGIRFVAIATGATFACAASDAHVASCWGYDDQGQLGNGTTSITGQAAPTPITGSWAFVAMAAGAGHACGLTTAFTAMCWGANERGQLGIGSWVTQTTAVAVAGGMAFASITAGTYHTCATTASGVAYCWGHNHYGRLGNGLSDNQNQWAPQAIVGGLAFAEVSAGGIHSCGVTTAGAAYCWGGDRNGQVGDGASDSLVHPSPEPVVGGLTFRHVSAGIVHSCGVTTAGAIYCWGDNTYGALGDGTTTGRSVPVRAGG